MFHLPAQVGRLLDTEGFLAPRLVVVAAPVLLLVIGAAVEGPVAAGAPRRRLDAADGTLARKWDQIVAHFVTRYNQASLATPKRRSFPDINILATFDNDAPMGAQFPMSALCRRRPMMLPADQFSADPSLEVYVMKHLFWMKCSYCASLS